MSVALCTICKLSTENECIALHEDGTIVHEACVKVAQDAIKEANATERTCWGCTQKITLTDQVTWSDEGGLWHPDCLKKAN